MALQYLNAALQRSFPTIGGKLIDLCCSRSDYKIGAIPVDALIVEPGSTELGFKTFAEAAFGLGIDVDAFGDVHVNSSMLNFE